MKKTCNKILLSLITVVTLATMLLALTACNSRPVVQTDTETVVTVTQALYEDGDTLLSYMDRLAEKNKLSFTTDSGMILVINGREAKSTANEYWFIYTSDAEYANTAWGTYDYDGKTYGSATLGIASLPVKVGETYVFAISSF